MSAASPLRIGVLMNGVTGRMGTNQHLRRSILSIRRDGGLEIPGIGRILPEPVLVGRNRVKLERLSRETGVGTWTDRLDRALEDPANQIYFDAQTTPLRATARNRPPPPAPRRIGSTGWRKGGDSSTAWSRTSCGCPESCA